MDNATVTIFAAIIMALGAIVAKVLSILFQKRPKGERSVKQIAKGDGNCQVQVGGKVKIGGTTVVHGDTTISTTKKSSGASRR
jgi:hypothetical protein